MRYDLLLTNYNPMNMYDLLNLVVISCPGLKFRIYQIASEFKKNNVLCMVSVIFLPAINNNLNTPSIF